ncbi:DUF5071 domain-containing protein [Planococcus sp. CAU13]|uniref:DUF5071 domain-containing protein n=1 Tax=Planococcus sp. CAU13 TaxID=1541197 RepID=UPI00052FF7D1|nr:DUF5071 domain-containing protein [Planococcus sp. CAU13]
MKDLKNLLPRNKYDVEQAKKLKDLDRSQVLLLLPDLIGYTQDINWPVAPIVVETLLTFPTEIIPSVQAALAEDDDNWKWFLLNYLVSKLPLDSKFHFKGYLIRVAETPTESEMAEELDHLSKSILETM